VKNSTALSIGRARKIARSAIKAMALAALVGFLVVPAIADERDKEHRDEHQARQQQRRPEPHRDQRREVHGYGYGNYYPQPIYAPPVVTYVEPQSPGITLFVPLNLHIH